MKIWQESNHWFTRYCADKIKVSQQRHRIFCYLGNYVKTTKISSPLCPKYTSMKRGSSKSAHSWISFKRCTIFAQGQATSKILKYVFFFFFFFFFFLLLLLLFFRSKNCGSQETSRKLAYIMLTPLNPTFIW